MQTDRPARTLFAAIALHVAVALYAYGGSFSGPFILDDEAAILRNPTIRSLWPAWGPLLPPCDASAVDRRPVTNLSLALNHAWGGFEVDGYHAVNVTAHVLTALALFWIVRRTLALPCFEGRFASDAAGLALATSLVWAAHPLLTNAVTYVVQRTEVLAGLFSFLTIACVMQATVYPASPGWQVAAVITCLLAMGSKESAAVVPVLALAYDSLLVEGTWRGALRKRGHMYAALATTWLLPIGYLIRDRLVGVSQPEVSFMARNLKADYWLSQFHAICLYLKLSFFPSPLIMDYGPPEPSDIVTVAPAAIFVLLLFAAAARAILLRRPIGMLGLLFFGPLAPSSLMPIVPEWAAEKRMYMPLAAVVLAVVHALHAAVRRLPDVPAWRRRASAVGAVVLCASAVAWLGDCSSRRNRDYQTAMAIWQDTVDKCPRNARAQSNLGACLEAAGRPAEAAEHYGRALESEPDSPIPLMNLAGIQLRSGETRAAVATYERIVSLLPTHARARRFLGQALLADGRAEESVEQLHAVVRMRPDYLAARIDLAQALDRAGRADESLQELMAAAEIAPQDGELMGAVGQLLGERGRAAEAIPYLEAAVRCQPALAQTRVNLAAALAATGRTSEAIPHYRSALKENPNLVVALASLADALVELGTFAEAQDLYAQALQVATARGQADLARRLGEALEKCREQAARKE